MKREIACRLDGEDVVQTTTVTDAEGKLHSETEVRLGNREVVLEQIEKQVSEATRERDGVLAASTTRPTPAADGQVGAEETLFFLQNRQVYRVSVRRNGAGKVASSSVSSMGQRPNVIENVQERLRELTELRDAIAGAK